jgi:PAS domain S-box-containing protein
MRRFTFRLTKVSLPWVAFVIFILVTLGVLGTWWTSKYVDREKREELLNQALLVKQAVNVQVVKTFTGTNADLNSANYQQLAEQLSIILKTKNNCRYLYLLGRNPDGSVFFFLDIDEVDKAKPGEVYHEASKALKEIFDKGNSLVEGPLPDKWGTWVTALVPVNDDQTGKVIAVLGMDVDAQIWKSDVLAHTAWPLSLVMAALVLMTLGILVVRHQVEKSVRVSEARLRKAEFASKSGNWELHLNSSEIYASDGAMKIYGLTSPRIDYSDIKKMPLTEYRPMLDKAMKELIKENKAYDVEFKIKTANTGEIKDIHSAAVFDAEKKIVFGIIQDITYRKQVEDALSESEQRYRLHFENSMEAFLLTAPDGTILSANPAACQMFGLSVDEMTGGGRMGIIDQTDPRLQQAMAEREKTGKFSGELTGVRKDGTKFPIELSATVFTDNKGNLRSSMIIKDISMRKEAEDTIRKSEKKWHLLVETIPDYIALYDADGKYLFLNHFAEGFSAKDIEGKTYVDFLTDESKDIYIEAFRKAKETKETQYNEYRAFGDNYTIRNYESFFVPIFEKEVLVNMLVIARDITERKLAEAELLKTKQQYDNLVSKIPVGVYILKTKPDGFFALEYASPRMAELLGLSVEDLLANNEAIFKAIHPEDLDSFIRLNHTGILNKVPFDWKGRVVVKGDIRWLHISSNPEPLDRGEMLWHGLIVNITERMQDEAEIKLKNEELTNLNATKDKFFSIIAHDLKSPFNSIIGFSSLLTRHVNEGDLEGIRRYATIIQDSSQQALDLLMNLLEWSRSQIGRMEFTPEEADISALISQSVGVLIGAAQQKQIAIHKQMPASLVAWADKAMINAILRNFISNAIKFTNPGGTIVISAEQTTEELQISVVDNGVGISKESIDKLFRIEETHSTLGTQREKGTGLGLLLCKEFVDKHGGRIWVESAVGEGSNFSFSIPRKKETQ